MRIVYLKGYLLILELLLALTASLALANCNGTITSLLGQITLRPTPIVIVANSSVTS